MNSRSLVAGALATMSLVWAVHAQTAQPARPQPAAPAQTRPAPAPARPAAPTVTPAAAASTAAAITVDHERAFLKQYCVACHSDAARAAGMDSARKLQIDQLDPGNLERDRDKWELIVRKVRAGQMPPVPSRRPEPQQFDALISFLESELDRTAKPFMPPPGLHRLNRTEYANVIRDLLDLDIDPSAYLP